MARSHISPKELEKATKGLSSDVRRKIQSHLEGSEEGLSARELDQRVDSIKANPSRNNFNDEDLEALDEVRKNLE